MTFRQEPLRRPIQEDSLVFPQALGVPEARSTVENPHNLRLLSRECGSEVPYIPLFLHFKGS